MKLFRLSIWFRLGLLVSDATTSIVSSYTFDPLNNSWKPSATRQINNRSRHSSSSVSSYSYAPAEPTPVGGLEFSYNENDIVRHHYTTWGVGDSEEDDCNDPSFVPKKTLVEIQYNKRTGEVSLLDEDGVVTPEEYKRIMNAVKYSCEGDDDCIDGITTSEQILLSQERQEDFAVGTTQYFDPEDLDPTDIIDAKGHDISVEENAGSTPIDTPLSQDVEIHQYPQQLQDNSDPSIIYYKSEVTSSPASTEMFNSYSIPQPATDNNHPVPQYQYYPYLQHPVSTASVVAGAKTEQYYQKQTRHQYVYAKNHPTVAAEQPFQSTDVEIMEEELHDQAPYQSSWGLGFSHRREFFTGSN